MSFGGTIQPIQLLFTIEWHDVNLKKYFQLILVECQSAMEMELNLLLAILLYLVLSSQVPVFYTFPLQHACARAHTLTHTHTTDATQRLNFHRPTNRVKLRGTSITWKN